MEEADYNGWEEDRETSAFEENKQINNNDMNNCEGSKVNV